MAQEKSYLMNWEQSQESTYLGNWVSVCGGCKTAVTARVKCLWVRFMEFCECLYGRRFPSMLERAVYKGYVRPASNSTWK